ncbi:MAG TPA: hypothetical protein VMH06_03385 [Thermodesulfovibrionales bacterium]|nr:hypothetical protein [Thermodesulfovibrionales bacterium]
MKRTTAQLKMDCLARDHRFEQERLLNLIECRIRRNEIELARGFAEDLFRNEIEFALREKTRRLGKYTRMLLKIMLSLLGLLSVSVICTVLDIRPSFNLLAQVVAILAIIVAILVNSLLVKRFGKAVRRMLDMYEAMRQSFIDRLIEGFLDRGNRDITLRTFSLTVVKQGAH